MKIVHFSWEFPPVIYGGLGTFATEITQKQVSLGNEITVFSLNEGNNLSIHETWNNIEVYRPKTLDLTSTFFLFADHELRSWGEYFKFFADVMSYNVLSASNLVNQLVRKKGNHYDIIDAHDWLGIIGGMVAKRELNIPLMFHVHSTEVGRSVGRGSHTIKDIEFEGGQTADCVITVSHAMSDELQKLGFPPDKIQVCWNGVDPHKYDPSKIPSEHIAQLRGQYGIRDDEQFLFFIGRLVTVKGVDKLVEAMPSILGEFPKVKLVILGIGDMEHHLRSRINELGLNETVFVRAEFVSETERILHYAASDVVVLPSLYEPFGIVCTEGMSMAKPVVVGAQGTNGMREQVIPSGNKQCGIHINPFNPEDIAWGVKQALQSKDKRKKWGKNGRARVIEQFSWDAVAQRTLTIYEEFVPKIIA
jgi:glycosyltransferase involved in cell wall biosynthesis